ncbi:haloacid dehalogenase [Crucibulum laeve]|uniref:Haloacid dehalogenase n=1 Tax=Crucibulum laeve TaxID=68775 RepID=A0A5C3LMB4_9AGAR|nr:haloacid dehalogenase [Crucibulum laeve]
MPKIEALIFDVFGTVVDWRSTVTRELKKLGERHAATTDWGKFAQEWRVGYLQHTRRIAAGGTGSFNVDIMHREILESMLNSEYWSNIGSIWSEETRNDLNMVWHRLDGWPDATSGLYALKKHTIVASLSNGNVRLLVDMAKHADLPWDAVFSAELFQAYKPNPNAYLSALRHLSIPPERAAMVAAHIYDLRAAGGLGMQTVYVPRPNEEGDPSVKPEEVKSKKDGGEVDWVVGSFEELAQVVERVNKE